MLELAEDFRQSTDKTMLSVVIFLACAALCSAYPRPSCTRNKVMPLDLMDLNVTGVIDERIIGGKEVVKNSYPFVVRIEGTKADGNQFLCGASLLHQNFVVTAAHCVHDGRMPVVALTLHFGDHNLWHKDSTQSSMAIPMANVRYHQQYSEYSIVNDIALIQLPRPAPVSQYVKPICVATPERASGYGSATAIGWGLTQNNGQISDVLKEVDLPVLHHGECRQFGSFNPTAMVCAGNSRGIQQSICSGDSGGPFVANPSNPILIGLSSFGSNQGCVTVGYPVVFTRVPSYIPWLRTMMGSALCTV